MEPSIYMVCTILEKAWRNYPIILLLKAVQLKWQQSYRHPYKQGSLQLKVFFEKIDAVYVAPLLAPVPFNQLQHVVFLGV